MKKQNPIVKIIFKIIVYAALIAMTVSILVPVAWVFMASFKRNAEFIGQGTNPWALPEQLQYQNYITAFIDAEMGKYFLNSVIVTALSLILLLVIALPAAYALSRFDFKGKKILNIAFMAVPIFLMLSDANKALGVDFFLDNRFVLSVIYASSSLSFSIYLLSGYFKTLPKGFEEAAYIDGCGYFKTMVQIMIPMAKPSILTVILFQFLSFWNEYIIAFTIMDDNSTLAVGLKNLMAVERTATNYGIMYAGLVIVMIPVLILYICVQKQLTKGMTLGGLKG